MPAYHSAPDVPARGGILVLHEVFGITPHIESVCQRFAGQGWEALAPALFHRDGSPVIGYSEPAAGVTHMNALTVHRISADLDAATSWLNGIGWRGQSVGAIGFCMGGSISLYAATTRRFGAAVTFCGVGLVQAQAGLPPLVELAPAIRCPWLGIYGSLDSRAPAGQVNALRDAAAAAPGPTEVVVYEGAGHAFNCDARPDRYNPAAAASAWQRALRHFDDNLGSDRPIIRLD